jgi:predicted DNA-binding transcriptional regulator YafY
MAVMSGGHAKVVSMGTHQRRYALWALLASATRGFTLRELAARFDVAKNTVQRDLDQLSAGGATITEEQAGQTLLFKCSNGPPCSAMSEDEKLALKLAAVSARAWQGTAIAADLEVALARVGAACEVPFEARDPVARIQPRSSVLKVVLAALGDHRQCALSYRRRGALEARVAPARDVALRDSGAGVAPTRCACGLPVAAK